MADNTDPFAQFSDAPANPGPQDAATIEPGTANPQPLTGWQRFVAQTIFDTQPKRRAAYLAKAGWQLDPNNDNLIRPMGSKEPYVMEIDPGGYFDSSQYMAEKYGGKKGATWQTGASELGADVAEGMLDMIEGAVVEATGQVAAKTTASSLASTGVGLVAAAPAAVAARSGGRAIAYNIFESTKDLIGDIIMDEAVPVDMEQRIAQTAIQAIAPEATGAVVSGGAKALKKVATGTLGAVKNGILKLLTFGGGKIDDVALQAVAKQPHLFDDAGIKAGGNAVQAGVNSLFGIDETDAVPKNWSQIGEASPFKVKMNTLDAERRAISQRLGELPQGNVKVKDAVAMLQQQIDTLGPASLQSKTGGHAAVKELQDRIKLLIKDHGAGGTLRFDEVDQLVQALQTDAWGREDKAAPMLRSAARSLNEHIKGLANKFADVDPAIAKYAGIKAQEAKIFDAADVAMQNINQKNVMNVVIGGLDDKLPTGFGKDVTRNKIAGTLDIVDDALGSNFKQEFQTGQIRNNIFQAIQSSKLPQGSSGNLLRFGMGYSATAPFAGRAAGVAAGTGAMVLGTPSVALPAAAKLSGVQQGIRDVLTKNVTTPIDQAVQRGVQTNVGTGVNAAIEALSKNVMRPNQPPAAAPEDDDPFKDF